MSPSHINTYDNPRDAADKAKERGLYSRCNVSLRTFYFSSEHVKNNSPRLTMVIYVCDFYRKSSYNNAFRKM